MTGRGGECAGCRGRYRRRRGNGVGAAADVAERAVVCFAWQLESVGVEIEVRVHQHIPATTKSLGVEGSCFYIFNPYSNVEGTNQVP